MRDIYDRAERLGFDRPDVQGYLRHAERGFADHARRGLDRLLRNEGYDVDGEPDVFEPWPDAEELYVPNGIELGWESHVELSTYLDINNDVSRGVLIPGSHGIGKTTAARSLLSDLHEQVSIVGFDTERRDWAPFAHDLRIPYFRKKHCCFNPLRPPPNTPIETWFQEIAGGFVTSFYLMGASQFSHINMIVETYEELKKADRFPAYLDVLDRYLRFQPTGKGQAEREYISRTLPKLQMLCFAYGKQLAYETGFDFAAILNRGGSFFLELPDAEDVSTFIIIWVILWFYRYRINNPHAPRHLIVFSLDERRHLLRAKDTMGSADLIGKLVTMLRGIAAALLICTQTPSDLSVPTRGNLGVVVSMRNQDIQPDVCRQIQGLTRDQADELRRLPVGQAILTVPTDRLKQPVLVTIPKFRELRPLTDKELDAYSEASVRDLLLHVKKAEPAETPVRGQPARDPNRLSEDQTRCLRAIHERPEPMEHRCRRLGWNNDRDYAARTDLERLGYIQLGGTIANRLRIHTTTPKGAEYARKQGWPKPPPAKSGPCHEALALLLVMSITNSVGKLVRVLRTGYGPLLDGVQPDIALRFQSGQLALVQVCDKNKPGYEVNRLFELMEIDAVDLVVSVPANSETRKKLESAIRKKLDGKTWPAKLIVLDANRCIQDGYDWAWIMDKGA